MDFGIDRAFPTDVGKGGCKAHEFLARAIDKLGFFTEPFQVIRLMSEVSKNQANRIDDRIPPACECEVGKAKLFVIRQEPSLKDCLVKD